MATPKNTDDQSEREQHVAAVDFDAIIAESKIYGKQKAVTFQKRGEEFTIPGPFEWPDAFVTWQSQAAQAGRGNPVDAARAMLGDDDYDRFLKVGGNAMQFMAFFEEYFGDAGESSAS